MLDPLLDILLQHDFWCTRRLLAACCELSPEQFRRPLGIGPGSLERTCTHLVGSLFFFAGRLRRVALADRPEYRDQAYTPHELLALLDQAEPALRRAVEAALATHALADPLNWSNADEGEVSPEDQVSYAVALAQMIDHGIHHRAQAVDMLELLGYPHPLSLHPFEWDEAVRGIG